MGIDEIIKKVNGSIIVYNLKYRYVSKYSDMKSVSNIRIYLKIISIYKQIKWIFIIFHERVTNNNNLDKHW